MNYSHLGFTISDEFCGGNIQVLSSDANTIYLERDLRDTQGDWFYWAFKIEGAEGQTLRFVFPRNRIGYFGPAISHDLQNYEFLETVSDSNRTEWTYTFGAQEHVVYFAHHILYPMNRFSALCAKYGLQVQTFTTSRKGRPVPCTTFGDGEQYIILTARHHACENTGSYVLEGVVESLITNPLKGFRYLVVPFVDYDGVYDGDQGKNRTPHDHNRDYVLTEESIYPETGALRAFAEGKTITYAFDFHSPWHKGDQNDTVFIPQNTVERLPALTAFGNCLESSITQDSLPYVESNDFPPNTGWNRVGNPTFGTYFLQTPGNKLAFTLETTFFGLPQGKPNSISQMLALGHSFAASIHLFEKGQI